VDGEHPVALVVQIGLADHQRVEILSGLAPGIRIAREDPGIAGERVRLP
jgi:hypothetical protein